VGPQSNRIFLLKKGTLHTEKDMHKAAHHVWRKAERG
jgi:hypothetical protein